MWIGLNGCHSLAPINVDLLLRNLISVFVRKRIKTRRYINIAVGNTVYQSKIVGYLKFAMGKAAFGEGSLNSLGILC
jgi:hypothetical protein